MAEIAPSFTDERLSWLLAIEQRHFWFAGRRRLVRRLLDAHGAAAPCDVLDLGVGGGLLTEQLDGAGFRMTAVDFLSHGLRRLQQTSPAVRSLRSMAETLALAGDSFDVVLALDVLEHTDDQPATRRIADVLREGGLTVVTVPAFDFLWSVRDDDAGHRRRYTRRTLRALLHGAGLQVLEIGYYQCLLFPFVLATRAVSAKRRGVRDLEDMPPRLLNDALRVVNDAEVRLGAWVNWPIGSSVYAVATKPRATS